jgi:hypothetical protein
MALRLPNGQTVPIAEVEIPLVSDGYHTFAELYAHRHALFAALTAAYPELSWRKPIGSHLDGWFLVGMSLPHGQVSYHLPQHYWHEFNHCLAAAPDYDGHTSQDVIDRLGRWRGPVEPAMRDERRVTLKNLMMSSAMIDNDQVMREQFGNWLAEGPPKPPPKDLGYSTPQVLGTLLAAVLVFGGAVAAGGLLSQWLVTR